VSDERLDQLAKSARNRGLKLVRSRVRTPGKPRFGKVGLTDASGMPVFGMDSKGPIGKTEDVGDFLRNLGAKDWGASLNVAVLPRKKKAKAKPEAANDSEPARSAKSTPPPPPKPRPEPKTRIRNAKPSDSERIAALIGLLEHQIDEKTVRRNLGKLKKSGELPLVATLDRQVVGLCGVHAMLTIHRPAPVGRITVLVVAEEARDRNIGRMLVGAAEDWSRKKGCRIIEVTSNDRRAPAHAFYRHMGYERTSIRFFKKL